jgi:hypothetical protein
MPRTSTYYAGMDLEVNGFSIIFSTERLQPPTLR